MVSDSVSYFVSSPLSLSLPVWCMCVCAFAFRGAFSGIFDRTDIIAALLDSLMLTRATTSAADTLLHSRRQIIVSRISGIVISLRTS